MSFQKPYDAKVGQNLSTARRTIPAPLAAGNRPK